jgi:hypothetical protein
LSELEPGPAEDAITGSLSYTDGDLHAAARCPAGGLRSGSRKNTIVAMEDPEFLRQFETCTLPYEQWTHRAHVKVAFLYLRDNSFAEALKTVRSRIEAYNAHNQVPESPTSGYNETTTRAFLQIVYATMGAYEKMYPTPDADSFCDTHTQLLNRSILRLFYSPERRSHPDAKQSFVEPDLAPLPRVIEKGIAE